MVQYITRRELERLLKTMAILDIVMISKEKSWLRLVKFSKKEEEFKEKSKTGELISAKKFLKQKMIDKTPIPGLDMNNYEAKAQINNFWNHLNDLAENNPEEYKKFISSQFKKGIEMYGKDKPGQNQPNSTTENSSMDNRYCHYYRSKSSCTSGV